MSLVSVLNLRKELHIDRSGQISKVLARHGLDYLVGTLSLERFAATQRLFGHAPQEAPFSQPEHLRLAREEMGTTFVKLGPDPLLVPICCHPNISPN